MGRVRSSGIFRGHCGGEASGSEVEVGRVVDSDTRVTAPRRVLGTKP